ncbi:P2 family phage major capsid protein [Escherichia coli]|uniref:P2 family phage major capsid protein n=1 Tax=Escherichia coli TaxID=562 RepID=UPI00203D4DEB|nr:P2 family phage major capsid protein [Escherichia coli]
MKKNTRFAFNAYLQQLARLNGVAVEELSSKFTVEPSVQQTLEDQIQQSAAFLTLINVTPVPDQSRARLHKAIGAVLSERNPASALNHLNHALQLDPRCGVKKDKQQLERRLRNDSR